MGEAGGKGLFEGGMVHPGSHQALAGLASTTKTGISPPVIEAWPNALPSSIDVVLAKEGHPEVVRARSYRGAGRGP